MEKNTVAGLNARTPMQEEERTLAGWLEVTIDSASSAQEQLMTAVDKLEVKIAGNNEPPSQHDKTDCDTMPFGLINSASRVMFHIHEMHRLIDRLHQQVNKL